MNFLLIRPWQAVLLILLTGWNTILHAQDEKRFRLYTAADGLTNSSITGIAQDNNGYIWISTMRGMNRYDGKRFVQYLTGNDNNSLPDESVSHLFWLDKDRLAASTSMGLHIINTKTGEGKDIIVPAFNAKYLYKYNVVMSVQSDPQGNIYILGRSGFYHYDAHYKLVYRYDYYTSEQTTTLPFEFGEEVYRLSDSELLLITINGPYIYNTAARRLKRITAADPLLSELSALKHGSFLVRQSAPGRLLLLKDSSNSIAYIDYTHHRKIVSATGIPNVLSEFNWRSTLCKINDTLYCLTSYQKGFFRLHIDSVSGKVELDTARRFPAWLCTGIIPGNDNRLWVATTMGLLKENRQPALVQQIAIPDEVLQQTPDLRIKQLFCYKDKLYVGCLGKGGLLVCDKNTGRFLYRVKFKKYNVAGDFIYSVIHARNDTLLVGNGPLYWLKASTGETGVIPLEGFNLINDWISYLFTDSHGNIWATAANDEGSVYLLQQGAAQFRRIGYSEEMFKELLVPVNVSEDQCGNIWMNGHGLCRINHGTGKPDLYIDSFPYLRFPRRQLTALTFDKNSTLWAGVNNNGLISYNTSKATFRHFTSNDGLPDNLIRAVYALGNKLWIATAAGMASFDLQKDKLSRFGREDGFPLLPVTSTDLYYDTATHYMYCGFTDHIVRFNPDSISHTVSPPCFFIESIHFFNDTTFYYPHGVITIPYYKNDFTVGVGTINYNDPSNERIMYRIADSEDSTWQALQGDVINFNNLQPGTYRLQIKLSALNNRWLPQQKQIVIVIALPFWRTPWFTGLIALLVAIGVYLVYRQNINIVRKTERAKVQVQELKAEEYKNRLELEKISNYFSSSLSGITDINEMLWDVAHNLIGRMGYQDCMIYLWNEDKTKMLQKAGYGPKGTPEAILEDVFDVLPGQGVVGYVMQTREPVLIADTRKDKRYRPDDLFRLSEVCVPVIHNDELLGVIDTEHHECNYFKERDMKILTTIATLVGNKIMQIESEKSLAIKREELATINEQLAEAQLTALQAQMNPHFIFNALNSIKRMILDNENRNASRYLSRFAQMIRLTLNHSKETFVTLQETIEYLYAYLDMEQLRFGSSFSYIIETTGLPDEEEINIPTLMIQPLVENAIWHGLMHRQGDKKIVIRFEQYNDMVTCIIEDNGIGIRASRKMKQENKRPSVGLENLRNRIKIMNEKYNMNCSLGITDLSETDNSLTGTRVVLKFKILT